MYYITLLNRNNEIETLSFKIYYDLLKYIANGLTNGTIKDQDVLKLEFDENQVEDINHFCHYIMNIATEIKTFDNMIKVMLGDSEAEYDSEEYDPDNDPYATYDRNLTTNYHITSNPYWVNGEYIH